MTFDNTPQKIQDMLAVAIDAAKEAGKIHLELLDSEHPIDHAFKHDIKLRADRLSENRILQIIRTNFGNVPIIAEESGEAEAEGDCVWIIDPLDGTMNFFYGIRYFCTCIACYRRTGNSPGEPLFGVIYAAASDEMFIGVRGHGATLNGNPIRIGEYDGLANSIVAINYGNDELAMQRMERITHELLRRTRKVRVLGSCGLDLASVACGRLSALIQHGVKIWDFAAGRVIVEEAGGAFWTNELVHPQWELIATAPSLMPDFRGIMTASHA